MENAAAAKLSCAFPISFYTHLIINELKKKNEKFAMWRKKKDPTKSISLVTYAGRYAKIKKFRRVLGTLP